ncbi:DUF4113 domain-containing protein [Klebsiella michiganensis]
MLLHNVTFAGQGIDIEFSKRREMLNPEYTVDWNALLRVMVK